MQLLTIFVSGTFSEYAAFYSKNKALVDDAGKDNAYWCCCTKLSYFNKVTVALDIYFSARIGVLCS